MPTKNRSAFASRSNLTLRTLTIHTGWYVTRFERDKNLKRRGCTATRNPPPLLAFLIAMLEGYVSLANNARGSESIERRNQKHGGLAAVFASAGQPQEDQVASVLSRSISYIPTGS